MAMNNAGQPKLWQEADRGLTDAAYKAGMATVPKDLSRVYERMADSYSRTMAATTDMWGKVITAGGGILKKATENFIDRKKRENLGSAYEDANGVPFLIDGTDVWETAPNPDFDPNRKESPLKSREQAEQEEAEREQAEQEQAEQEEAEQVEGEEAEQVEEEEVEVEQPNSRTIWQKTHVMGLSEIQEGLWQTYLNKPFSKESIKTRAELNQKKLGIYAQIDMLQGGFNQIGQTLASGNYSKDAMKQRHGNARLLSAIGAMHSKSGASDNGDHIVASHNKDGELVLSLYGTDENGEKMPIYKSGNPDMGQISVRADRLNSLITPNMPKVRVGLTKLFDNFMQKGGARGAFDANGVPSYDMNVEGKKLINSLRDTFTDDNALQYAMFEDGFSHFQTSFAQDLTDQSYTSANLYRTLVEVNGLNADKKPNVPTDPQGNPIIDISGGTDPTGFDEMDLAGPSQYAAMVSAILNPENPNYNSEMSAEIVIDWARRRVTNESLAKQKLLKPISPWGANDVRTVNNKSGIVARNIMKAVTSGNLEGLQLPERSKGSGAGIVHLGDDGKTWEVHGGGDEILGDFGTKNEQIKMLMREWGVTEPHIYQYEKMGVFDKPLWNANNKTNEDRVNQYLGGS